MWGEVPAELVVERVHEPRSARYWDWVWMVCQPDANWGEWDSGYAPTREEAIRLGSSALRRVHEEQGVH